jgi:putative tryptophan/tyrosine transport system substrate-binding protein
VRRRRALLALLALAGASGPLRAQGTRLPRIGYFLLGPRVDPPSRERQAFLDGLRALGYVPGKTVEIVYRSAEGELVFLDEMYQDLLAQKVDVIVTSSTLSVLAAKKATRSVPVVMLAQGDPVGVGAVKSLARPEANLTGVSFLSSELAGKRVELLLECVPAAKRIAVLWDTRNSNAVVESRAAIQAIRRLGASPEPHGLGSTRELERALARLGSRRPDALYVVFEGVLVGGHTALIAQAGLQHRIALVSGWGPLTEAGGLMSYAPDIADMFHRAASFVHRLLKGAKPAELPVEQATKIDLVVNLRTAKALGITIPPTIMVRADRVIQ